ncbi:triphosphoribosyl-dephospho-CoA synthase [Fictibacillus sp. B-59209]|uniref:triphosphoribosyl-dephospho-CoA synthase n=1 Tax=Fictibacillus sp. B-59209 TaxID=3024873 RepID=UPI002E216A48|nr:triphosphoribosyl-dephospho-CoA synthase [Fictibacillus sp. B-59209]
MVIVQEKGKKETLFCDRLAHFAVTALIDEAMLTPKPGLVDKESKGAHTDMSIDLMLKSAYALQSTFAEMAEASKGQFPSQDLREKLAEIGRRGEQIMFQTTNGVNTHKGAIWALGLLTASAAIHGPHVSPQKIAQTAGEIAKYNDRWSSEFITNGLKVKKKYGISGATGEAQQGFPHIVLIALPVLWCARKKGLSETTARLDALLSIIAHLDDTCILHRGGTEALSAAKAGAKTVLDVGGSSTLEGGRALVELDRMLLSYNASPGGCADLLAGTLFLDRLQVHSN